jgi:hypothetical protein
MGVSGNYKRGLPVYRSLGLPAIGLHEKSAAEAALNRHTNLLCRVGGNDPGRRGF